MNIFQRTADPDIDTEVSDDADISMESDMVFNLRFNLIVPRTAVCILFFKDAEETPSDASHDDEDMNALIDVIYTYY